jgi:hypothetical protein
MRAVYMKSSIPSLGIQLRLGCVPAVPKHSAWREPDRPQRITGYHHIPDT